MTCPACRRIESIRAGDDPLFIAELGESFCVLHKHQRYEGWCVLWLKDHHEHLALLPPSRQLRLAEDVARTSAAIHRAFNPARINFECLGNIVPHIHWHIIPRRATDPDPRSTIWVRPEAETESGVTQEQRRRLIAAIRTAAGW